MDDLEKTDPGFGAAGLFDIVGSAFADKVRRVMEIAGYLEELKDPSVRDSEMWRLADAIAEMLDVGADFHNVVKARVARQPATPL